MSRSDFNDILVFLFSISSPLGRILPKIGCIRDSSFSIDTLFALAYISKIKGLLIRGIPSVSHINPDLENQYIIKYRVMSPERGSASE